MARRRICIRQHDETDCGPAVLATVARYFKRPVTLSRIRELAATDLAGTNLFGLAVAAEKIGFRATGIRANAEDLATLAAPVIAPITNERGLGHFVVVYRVKRGRVLIADPAVGLRRLSLKEFLERWRGPDANEPGGALLVLAPDAEFQVTKGHPRARRLWALARPRLPLLIEAFLCAVLGTLLALGSSFFVQLLVDKVVSHGEDSLLTALGLGMLLVIALRGAFLLVRQYLLVHLGQKVDVELFVEYFRHLMGLPVRFFRTRRVGEILSRLNDAHKVRSLVEGTTLSLILDVVMFVLAAVFLFSYHTMLALVVFAFVPVFAGVIHLVNRPVRRAEREVMEQMAEVEGQLVESLSGIDTIKGCGAERWARQQAEGAYVRMTRALTRGSLLAAGAGSCGLILAAAAALCVLWYGGSEVLAKRLTLGELMFFNTMLAFLLGPMQRLAEVSVEIQEAVVAIDRLFEILDLEPEERADRRTMAPAPVRGEFVIDNITFAYGHRDPVLTDVSLTIPAGSTVALVGESGSGKTTLANLLHRFDDPQAGSILLDAVDLRDWDLKTLRRVVGIVPQETFLFRGKIRDNIALGRPNARLDEIVAAAQQARAHDFVTSLPDRYESLIGERASDLSGGQRQRLAIARILLANPQVLILDEATSNLDSENEWAIQEMLKELHGNRTVILIAHRLSTVMHADQIVVLHQGQIAEQGSHDELMDLKGRYYAMWERQLPQAGRDRVQADGAFGRIRRIAAGDR
ncbi:MAG: peptidase domain-containing ABC transporter [Planctomycetota bacterium]